jgi:hypothetical protein
MVKGMVLCNATLDFSCLQRLAAKIVCEEVRRPLDQWKPETEDARRHFPSHARVTDAMYVT